MRTAGIYMEEYTLDGINSNSNSAAAQDDYVIFRLRENKSCGRNNDNEPPNN